MLSTPPFAVGELTLHHSCCVLCYFHSPLGFQLFHDVQSDDLCVLHSLLGVCWFAVLFAVIISFFFSMTELS